MDPAAALLTVRQMGDADRLSIAAGISAFELMANSGDCVANAIMARWTMRPLLVLCGPGNNGGDGFAAAQRLADAGWPVRVAMLGGHDEIQGNAQRHAKHWQGHVETLDVSVLEGAQLIVDALFGAGLSRPLTGTARDTLAAAAAGKAPIIAIDMPSGVMGDTGEVIGAVPVALTITFFRKKPGHLLLPARDLCGEVVVADIGSPLSVLNEIEPDTFENAPCLWRAALPQAENAADKHARGHALVYGGYPMTGTTRMAARAAARTGAGMTTVAVPDIALPIYTAALTSIMVRPIVTPEDFTHLLSGSRFSAWLIGPGAAADTATLVRTVAMLAQGIPTVIDADAITVFSG